jgi:hypothetical protein
MEYRDRVVATLASESVDRRKFKKMNYFIEIEVEKEYLSIFQSWCCATITRSRSFIQPFCNGSSLPRLDAVQH